MSFETDRRFRGYERNRLELLRRCAFGSAGTAATALGDYFGNAAARTGQFTAAGVRARGRDDLGTLPDANIVNHTTTTLEGSAVADIKDVEHSVALMELIAGVRRIVRAEHSQKRVAQTVAGLLEPYLEIDDLLLDVQMQPDPEKYRQQVLHVEGDGSFSIAALVWLPGQETPIHDHVSWCVVGVYKGTEFETRYELYHDDNGQPHLVQASVRLSQRG